MEQLEKLIKVEYDGTSEVNFGLQAMLERKSMLGLCPPLQPQLG